MSYSAPGAFVTPEDRPVNTWKRLFGGVAAPGGGVDRLLARRQSVLDLVRGEVNDLRGRVGAVERVKLEAHLDALRAVERGLSGTPPGACQTPAQPAALNAYDNGMFPQVGVQQMDLLVAALACGATRVASVQFAHTVAPQVPSWDPVGAKEGHHELSHKDDSDVEGVATFVRAERWFAAQFGYLIAKMAATPDPVRGGSLLDSSVVVWAKELGDSRLHTCQSVPFVLAGGANGRLQTGRYLKFANAPHQKLLVSICRAMGMQSESFGDAAKGAGPLEGLS